jgi:HEAT repeat protein
LLRGAREPQTYDAQGAASEIAALGGPVVPALLAMLAERNVPPVGELPKQGLSSLQESVVLAAIARIGAEPVEQALAPWLASASSIRARSAALLVLGEVAPADGITRMLAIAITEEEVELDRTLKDALRHGVAGVLERSDRALAVLEHNWRSGRPELIPALALAVGDTRNSQGVAILADILTWHAEHQLLLMSQIRLIGPSPRRSVNREVGRMLEPLLVGEDSAQTSAALLTLAALRDEALVPRAIELLAGDSQALAGTAHFALKKIAGLSFPPVHAIWKTWYDGEVEWFARDSRHEIARLDSGKDEEVVAVIRTISQHRLYREELADALAGALEHPNSTIRVHVCQGLQELGSEAAVPALVLALDDAHEQVRKAAWMALVSLTGINDPPEAASWREIAMVSER